MKLTITTGDLADLVNPVLPLASRDDTVPTLGGVLVERKGRWITASATDRYRLGVSRIRAREGQEDFCAVIDAPDIRRIVTVFKPSKYNNPEIALTVESDTLTAEATGGLDGLVAARVSLRLLGGPFPDLTKLVTRWIHGDLVPVTDAPMRGDFLADFKAASRTMAPLRLSAYHQEGSNKPVLLVRCGDHFFGALMGVSLADSDAPASWDDVFPAPVEEKAEAAA